tara:strand:- start:62569 stop:63693 length:1125 start_codon:yes stop_codon:yes gene_type:complete
MLKKLKQFPFLSTAILLTLMTRLVVNGLTWVGVLALVVTALWFCFDMVRWLMIRLDDSALPTYRKETDEEIPPENLASLVYFLSEPREANETSIRRCVSAALGIDFDTDALNSEHFVIEFNPTRNANEADDGISHFMVKMPQGLFAVLVSDRPYISNPSQFAKEFIRDKRLRKAVEQHLAWISVDLMDDPSDPEATSAAYQVIGQILATLAGPDCLAIYCPEIQRCNEFDLSLIETLSGQRPLDLFSEPTFEPIVEISDSNKKMTQAVREARQRWSEFLHSFAESGPGDVDKFIVKAEFREGPKCEYMWLSVTAASSTSVSGILMNDPHELMDIHRGASVTLEMDRLNDWIYRNQDGEHIGGFTLDVLAEGDEN